RSQLVRIPAAAKVYRRAELRSPDPSANPYIAFALIIRAALYGIQNKLKLPPAVDINLYQADEKVIEKLKKLPNSKEEAKKTAASDAWVREQIPQKILELYCK
ncbi:MAG: type I glutamate--ammonia ligase, partial [Clostridia bacterium]|nr:type I glutamate--ammonia ligase [Clostridia bacterium]